MVPEGTGPTEPYDVRAGGHQAGAHVVDGIPDDGDAESHRNAGSRMQQDAVAAPQQVVVEASVAYTAVEASSTTDPHHDAGAAATGHVEDATPDTAAAGVPDDHPSEATPPPAEDPPHPHEDPAPVEAAPVEAHHDDAAAATPDADHTT
jgi:hypothetical protein